MGEGFGIAAVECVSEGILMNTDIADIDNKISNDISNNICIDIDNDMDFDIDINIDITLTTLPLIIYGSTVNSVHACLY